MKAIRQFEYGGVDKLILDSVPNPVPGPGQVRIRVQAAGVQLLDVQLRSGQGPARARAPLPVTPGREVAGRIDAVGNEVDESWTGTYVVADLGIAGGGYAELALADVGALHRLSHDLDPAEAVAALGTGRTVQAILELAQLTRRDSLLVTGASGGIGTMLLKAARSVGANVVALASGEEKRRIAASFGAPALDSNSATWRQQALDALPDGGATVVADGVGGELGTQAMSLLGVRGRLVMFGTASGSPISLSADTVFASGITVSAAVGARLLARPGGLRDLEEKSLRALEDRSLVPVIGHRFSLTQAREAHRTMEERRSHGKVILLP
ncbi:zinc-binding dehydrogenase [Kribbella sp. NPDC048915]|uniref:zinc-binding dehydrogenase n=1 Tax=Kribbella sp. NPDC048915 TaxID=3155148 RepID=UPI0033E7DB40